MMKDTVIIRECKTLESLKECVRLQRDVFRLPELELSPVRHFIVTNNAGGFTLGAYDGEELIGFSLSVPAFLRGEKAFYSHMTAVAEGYQSWGIGARLKWAQRTEALLRGVGYIKWTFEPWKARNAFFNLEKLGATVAEYEPNFYGMDYGAATAHGEPVGLASDRLFAEWELEGEKAAALAMGEKYVETREPAAEVVVTNIWAELVETDKPAARAEQERLRTEFEELFARGLVCSGFRRDAERPAYLFYASNEK